MKLTLCAAALLIALAGLPAWGQQVPYHEDFESGSAGWQLHGLWGMDGEPARVPGGAAYSGAHSLNFNDGADYSGLQRGASASPAVLGQAGHEHVVRFRCNYRTETSGTRYDRRSVTVRVNSEVVLDSVLSGLSTAPPGTRCGPMGTWHTHEMRVPASHSARTQLVNIDFVFDSVDDIANGYPGWFVDDLEIEAVAAPVAQAVDSVTRGTRDFRDYTIETEIKADRSVEVRQSSPTARYALITGQATPAEWQALEEAVVRADMSSLPASIPDPNTYIVRPISFRLDVVSATPRNHGTVEGSFGIYGQWAPRMAPVMDAIAAIEARLLAGGVAPASDDHGDTPQDATTVTIDPNQAPTAGAIDPAGDVDFFQVVDIQPVIAIYPPPQRTYVVETTVAGAMDTVLELYAADGTTLLATNDDGGQGLGSRIVHTTGAGTVLYAKVRHYSASATGTYTIRAGGPSIPAPGPGPGPVADDHGDSPADATTLNAGAAPLAGSIDPAGEVDFFALQQVSIMIFPPPQYATVIETTVGAGMDTVLEVYAADGATLIASSDDAPGLGLASRVVLTGPASTYFVKVRHYAGSGTGAYTVSVTQTLAP